MTVETARTRPAPQITRARGGWWHDYVCPTHGTELEAPDAGAHPCPHGCRLVGPAYSAAWTVLEHQGWARRARLLARRAVSAERAEGPQPADARQAAADDRLEAETIVRDFAAYHAQVSGWSEQSETWMLRGKLFSQALTEAIWAVQLADAVAELATGPGACDRLGPETAAMVDGLLDTVVDARRVLVTEQGNPQSNYTAWLDAAGGLLARAARALAGTGTPDPRAHADGPDGAPWVEATWSHAALAVGADGWEWEGSTYYHLFVLRAYLLSHRGVPPAQVPPATVERLAAMVGALAGLATADGTLPAMHDGPYDRLGVHLEVLEVCVLARQLWASTGLDQVEAHARARAGARHDGLEDLLGGWFGGPPLAPLTSSRGSRLFEDVGYAVLRSPDGSWQAVLDAGPHGGSHGHLDKLGLYLYGPSGAWQPAPGVPPYGSALRKGHYARTLAHPTVRVDDADQDESSGTVVAWSTPSDASGATEVVARADDAYPGVRLTRQVVMAHEYLLDVVTVTCAAERDVTLALRPAGQLDVTVDAAGWTTRWSAGPGSGCPDLHGTHRTSVPATLLAAPGRGPSDDPARVLTVGDWTARTQHITYVSVYCPGDVVSDVELVTVDGSLGVRVHLRDDGRATTSTSGGARRTREHEVSR